MAPLFSFMLILLWLLIGFAVAGCSSYSHLDRQSEESPIVQTNQAAPRESYQSVSDGPLVRFPEWPIKEPEPEQKPPETQAVIEPPAAHQSVPSPPQQPQPAPAPPQPAPAPPQKQQPTRSRAPQPRPAQKTLIKEKPPQPTIFAGGNNKSAQLTLSQLVRKYPSLLLLKGSAQSQKIALTFDDAPDTQYTPQVLNILKKYNVKATFFVVGQLAEKHPAIVKRMAREGHAVGNHTYNHPLLTKQTDLQYQQQVNQTQRAIHAAVGYTPRLLRPPYGEITESQLLWASKHHLVVVNWNVDSLDWKQLNQEQVTSNILSRARAGSIILQHSGGGPNQNLSGTVDALPTIIESLQSRGYKLVTLPELLNVSPQL